MAQQTILRILATVAALAVFGAASAQTSPVPSHGNQPATQAGSSAGQSAAPFGHRQPRLGDMPADQSASAYSSPDRLSPEDEALNRRINGICRGC